VTISKPLRLFLGGKVTLGTAESASDDRETAAFLLIFLNIYKVKQRLGASYTYAGELQGGHAFTLELQGEYTLWLLAGRLGEVEVVEKDAGASSSDLGGAAETVLSETFGPERNVGGFGVRANRQFA